MKSTNVLRPLCLLLLVTIVALSMSGCKDAPPVKSGYKVGVFQVVHHPVLDTMAGRFQQELRKIVDKQIDYTVQVADGDPVKTEQMAQAFATGGYDLVFAIGTPQAQSLAKKNSSLPIVLGAATDPVASGLVVSWENPGKNITGTSDLSPVGVQLDRLMQVAPSVKRIGVIYNSLEDNSKTIVEIFKKECAKRGLAPVTATVSGENEIKQTFVSLVGKIDALYAPTDATVQQSFSVLSKLSRELKIPIFNCDRSTVENGAIFSVGFNYEELGRLSAEMAGQILQGKSSPDKMPIRFTDRPILYYNTEQLHFFGLDLPADWAQVGESIAK